MDMKRFYIALSAFFAAAAQCICATTSLNNLVVFVRFADEEVTGDDAVFIDHDIDYYGDLFNNNSSDANSVYNYFRKASYGKLEWTSSFYPAANGKTIVSFQSSMQRNYFRQKSSINEIGYEEGDNVTMAAREQALVKEVIEYLDNNLPKSVVTDANGDGIVDNLTIVLSGASDISSRYLLWPKRSNYILSSTINGTKVANYLLVFDESNGFDFSSEDSHYIPLNTGVICHEMSHNLGTYDLYHTSGYLNPVGVWDLMSDNQTVAQNMSAYTKWRYCKWIEDIPEISQPGTYTLNAIGGDTESNIAYKIKPVGHDEYFVVEYRRAEGFDASLPESGLIVYRINPNYSGGNTSYNGTTRLDEMYVLRPGGTVTADGSILKAAFSADNGRTALGGTADLLPFYSDGTVANFAIANIGKAGETISFDLLETKDEIVLSESNVALAGRANSAATVTVSANTSWTLSGVPDWLTVSSTTGEAGRTTITIVCNSANDTNAEKTATLTFANADGSASAQLTVTQQTAEKETVVLYEDFENPENPNGWVIQNSDNRGWHWQEGAPNKSSYYKTYEGSYCASLWYAWDDAHEDQYLISPIFKNATTLEFYSCTTAANKVKTQPEYHLVEVSSDGGETWTSIFNCCEDYPYAEDGSSLSNKYTKITLDLSDYVSDMMKIRFHSYDTDNVGLSYFWLVDNVKLTDQSAASVSDISVNRIEQPSMIYSIDGRQVGTDISALPDGIYIYKHRKIIVRR
jgi:M6 family metalloprotease-like protein